MPQLLCSLAGPKVFLLLLVMGLPFGCNFTKSNDRGSDGGLPLGDGNSDSDSSPVDGGEIELLSLQPSYGIAGSPFVALLSASQGSPMSFELVSGPAGLTLRQDQELAAVLEWTPPADAGGSYSVTVAASAGGKLTEVELELTIGALKPVATVLINAAQGGTVQVDDPSSPLHGVSLSIPADVLAANTEILISEVAPPPTLPEGWQWGGPVMDFSPSGLRFNEAPIQPPPYYEGKALGEAASAVNDAERPVVFRVPGLKAAPRGKHLMAFTLQPDALGRGSWTPVVGQTVAEADGSFTLEATLGHFSLYGVLLPDVLDSGDLTKQQCETAYGKIEALRHAWQIVMADTEEDFFSYASPSNYQLRPVGSKSCDSAATALAQELNADPAVSKYFEVGTVNGGVVAWGYSTLVPHYSAELIPKDGQGASFLADRYIWNRLERVRSKIASPRPEDFDMTNCRNPSMGIVMDPCHKLVEMVDNLVEYIFITDTLTQADSVEKTLDEWERQVDEACQVQGSGIPPTCDEINDVMRAFAALEEDANSGLSFTERAQLAGTMLQHYTGPTMVSTNRAIFRSQISEVPTAIEDNLESPGLGYFPQGSKTVLDPIRPFKFADMLGGLLTFPSGDSPIMTPLVDNGEYGPQGKWTKTPDHCGMSNVSEKDIIEAKAGVSIISGDHWGSVTAAKVSDANGVSSIQLQRQGFTNSDERRATWGCVGTCNEDCCHEFQDTIGTELCPTGPLWAHTKCLVDKSPVVSGLWRTKDLLVERLCDSNNGCVAPWECKSRNDKLEYWEWTCVGQEM